MRQGEITDPPAVRDVINNMIEDQKRVQQKRIQLLDTIKYDHIPLMPTANNNPYLSEIARQWRARLMPHQISNRLLVWPQPYSLFASDPNKLDQSAADSAVDINTIYIIQLMGMSSPWTIIFRQLSLL